jgi:hypothetical protein
MLAARVPQYETTTNVRIESGRVIAYFPPDALSHIHADQPALVHYNGATFPAQVQMVASDYAELVLANPQSLTPTSIPATAEVEVSHQSPAALALRTLGRTHQ